MKGSQQIFKGGGGGLLKINCNNAARGSWINIFCVCIYLCLKSRGKRGLARVFFFFFCLTKERKLGGH